MRLVPPLLHHAEALLAELLSCRVPADSVVSRYFRQHGRLGHSDRALIAEAVYAVLRQRYLLEAFCLDEISPRRLLLAWLGCVCRLNLRELATITDDSERRWLACATAVCVDSLPAAIRLNLPDWLYARLNAQLGVEETAQLAARLNQPAPLDLRVNPLKTDRDTVLACLRAEGIEAEAGAYSPLAIRLSEKPSLVRHPLFLDGRIEVQDEGSQLLAYLARPKRSEMVADFCAGAGGKTLLLGALMRSQGRLYALDVSEKRLAKLKPRLARSGLSNVHPMWIASENDARLKRLASKFDCVLVDAPCSGLGTLRRNPDLKWRQSEKDVAESSAKQRSILVSAAELVRPGGRLVYATCSLLSEENEAVVEAFLAIRHDFVRTSACAILNEQSIRIKDEDNNGYLRLWPHRHGTDGFFAAVMER